MSLLIIMRFFFLFLLLIVVTGCEGRRKDDKSFGYRSKKVGSMEEQKAKSYRVDPERMKSKSNVSTNVTIEDLERMAQDEGFRSGVRMTKEYYDNSVMSKGFKDKYYRVPVYEDVKVTGMVMGGVYVPAHREQVVHMPGQYDSVHKSEKIWNDEKIEGYRELEITNRKIEEEPRKAKAKMSYEQWIKSRAKEVK